MRVIASPTRIARAGRSRGDFVVPVLVFLAGLALGACQEGAAPRPTPSERPAISARGYPLAGLEIERDGRVRLELQVEIAETPEAWGKGLMGVERLDRRAGMAFLFPGRVRAPFFMKDVAIPLDIAFWDENSRIVDGFTMQPCAADPCPLYPPSAGYVGAIEMNGGLLAESGIELGDVVTLARRR